ncbi:B-cell receptor CD22-like isoform X2 [Anolis carolinensis]|uniref:B-cell receptor CD22-like isoform X2 n=1 Tax=Anolis carolinensis TaxID=28377 RepID=UPI002F2B1C84
MKNFFVLFLIHGSLCNGNLLSINPENLETWKGSCVLIPCQINETLHFAYLPHASVAWYFRPSLADALFDYNVQPLFDSSKTLEDHVNLTSPNFQGRVRFVGDLTKRDCSLMITELHMNDSGTYNAKVAILGENNERLHLLFQSAKIHVRETPPEPKVETRRIQTPGLWAMKVICSVSYHCPNEPMMLTLRGLEKHPQKRNIGNRTIQTIVSFEPTWEEESKKVICLLTNKDGSHKSKTTLQLDVKHSPLGVQLVLLNDLPIKEGDNVRLNCSVSRSLPDDNWYNWAKSDSHTVELRYSGPKLLTFPASPGPATSYKCEACNWLGCTSSQAVTVDVHCDQCYKTPLSIRLNSRASWKGSCVWIPCYINEAPHTVISISVLWYFEPDILEDYYDHLLYDSSKTPMNQMNLTSPRFQGRVHFIGNVTLANCSLMITQLQTKDSGTYHARVLASIPDYPWPLKRFMIAPVNVTETLPEPKMETVPVEIEERKTAKVICSAPYHCPEENMTLTLSGLEEDRLSSQDTTIENGVIRTVLNFEPSFGDHGKVLKCLLKSETGSQRSRNTMKLDVQFAPRSVIALPETKDVVMMGQSLQLRCEVGKANPQEVTYAWYKKEQELVAEGALLIISKASRKHSGIYHCNATNKMGSSRSSQIELSYFCSSSQPKDCYLKVWSQ